MEHHGGYQGGQVGRSSSSKMDDVGNEQALVGV
jgi:hypothetical protein